MDTSRRELIKRALAQRAAVEPHARPRGKVQRSAGRRYAGGCGACHRSGKWCGFDHEQRVFVKGRQARREREADAECIAAARKRLLAGVRSPAQRVAFLKLLTRLESAWTRRPVTARADPRHALSWQAAATLSASDVSSALAHLGVRVDLEEASTLVSVCGRRGRLSGADFVRLCAAARAYRPGVVRSLRELRP